MIPPAARFDALEISAGLLREDAIAKHPLIAAFPLVTASDAHRPEDIGRSPTLFLLERMDVDELRMALEGREEREYLIQ
jgi:PHP family Zn ribbon phosphoesterase